MTTTDSPRVDDQQFPQPQPSRSPARLRNNQLAATVAVLLFALVAIGQVLQLRSDLADRPQYTAQGVRVSQLEAELARAGRLAAIAPLGGKSSTELEESLQTASGLVVRAAAAGADADRLAGVNAALGEYSSLLRRAATGSDPSGTAQLLSAAETVLTDSLQPALEELASGIGAQAAGAAWLGWAFAAGGIAVICVLGWAWFRSSQLSHRVISPGLAIAAVLVAAMTVLVVTTITGTAGSGGSTDALRQAAGLARVQIGVETSARLQAQAVIAKQFTAEQAKAELAARQTTTKAVDNTTPDEIRRASSTAVDNLKDSAELLAKAAWADATASLLGTDGTSLPKNLTALATSCTTASDELVQDAADAPSSQSITLVIVAVGIALLAAAAAVAIDWGIGARLKEYQ